MRLIRVAALATLLSATATATATHAGANENKRYLELINRAHDSVTSLAIAAAGSGAFREMPLGALLHGGGDSTTIEIAGESCLYDFRFIFRNGRTLIYRDVNICRGRSLRIRPLPQTGGNRQDRSGQPLTR